MSAGPPPLDVSVVLCTRNRRDLLRDAVESILAGNRVPAEVVVIDQSDEPDAELAAGAGRRGCRLRYLATPSRGLSRACNEGIAAASRPLLAFTHDDVRVDPDWLEMLVAAHASAGGRSVVTGRVEVAEEGVDGGFQLAVKTDAAPTVYTGPTDRDVLYPLNMALGRDVVTRVGAFDPRLGPGTPYPGAEDSDLGFRILAAGIPIVYVPAAVVWHRAWRPAGDYVRLRWSYGLARGGFYAKHLRGAAGAHVRRRLRADVRSHLVAGLLGIRVARRRAIGDLALAAGICAGAARWLVLRGR